MMVRTPYKRQAHIRITITLAISAIRLDKLFQVPATNSCGSGARSCSVQFTPRVITNRRAEIRVQVLNVMTIVKCHSVVVERCKFCTEYL